MSQFLVDGANVLTRGRMTADDVAQLRRGIFQDGIIGKDEADLVFRLNDECRDKDESWGQLYVDALTDYFVWRAKPWGYVSEEQGRFLTQRIVRNNRIENETELELLCNIMHWAEYAPAELAEFVLFAVRESVLDPDKASYGVGRHAKVVDPVDVELIKRAIYAPATSGGITVTRLEAEVIFDINDATVHEDNHPSWDRLFVYAIANHLMFPRAASAPMPAEDVLRRERWLKERTGAGGLLKKVGREIVLSAKTGRLEWKDAIDSVTRGSIREVDPVEEYSAARIAWQRETIDEEEARWLIARIGRDGKMQGNEVALLKFIKDNSPNIDPSLNPLFEQAGLA
jgi:hypothetical protein